MTMKTTVIDNIKGSELPLVWAERAAVRPDDEVQITIGPSRGEAAKELLRIMDQMGEEAERRGLTDEKLAELLRDES